MTSISAASGSNYQSPLQLLQSELQSEVNSGAVSSTDQSALSSALTDINSSLQGGDAEQLRQQHQCGARRYQIEDRQPDRRRSLERQADRRSGHRIAGRVPGTPSPAVPAARVAPLPWMLPAPRALGAPGGPGVRADPAVPAALRRRRRRRSSRSSWRPSAAQRHQLPRHRPTAPAARRHQFNCRCASAISPVAAGFPVELVVVDLQRDRQHHPCRQQFVLFGTADQLPDLISRVSTPADAHRRTRRSFFPEREGDRCDLSHNDAGTGSRLVRWFSSSISQG